MVLVRTVLVVPVGLVSARTTLETSDENDREFRFVAAPPATFDVLRWFNHGRLDVACTMLFLFGFSSATPRFPADINSRALLAVLGDSTGGEEGKGGRVRFDVKASTACMAWMTAFGVGKCCVRVNEKRVCDGLLLEWLCIL